MAHANFILGTMASEACSIQEALSIAQQHGFAEPDPSADLSNRDAAEKLCVLADAIGIDLAPHQIRRSGIESIDPDDLRQARHWGFEIKCIAELDGARASFAGPVLVPRGHQLSQVRGTENALVIDTERGGEIVLRGKGAGPDPTSSAVHRRCDFGAAE
jgi:homoserine dehydrogenase